NVSKTFRIPHEKITSVKGAVTSLFKSGGYEEFKALDDVSFEVKKGEFFGIIGRNGSGKSTLLKILAGIYQADSGKVAIDGMISPFLELGIGFNPELSGRDNVYLNATVLGMTKKQIDAKFDDIVKFSELERFIDQKLKNYSSGMQVRLAFSVSIHANRDILLMDEVLAVGDTNFQSKCLEEFNKYREMGRTVIIVTHDISVVERYCSRAMLLRNGKIVKLGKANEVANEYIQGNITDEERRLSRVENKICISNNDEKSKKIAEIAVVKLLDKNRERKNTFKNDEVINIEIGYIINKKVDTLNLGIGIHSATGIFIFGCNTQIDRFKVSNESNSVILKLNKCMLLKGEYFINATLYGNVVENLYDYKPKCKHFQIFPTVEKNKYSGIIFIEHGWE
ncbi:TPA: ABC transporter ATP-binding protein, partial [Candidatus Nomurabacteria bacterium]|nr:ABC transporter ATP-binding protein [Candidatus Nomurabacteria bacterium]